LKPNSKFRNTGLYEQEGKIATLRVKQAVNIT